MTDKIKSIQNLLERLYATFVLRDLTFLVSGGLILFFSISNPLEDINKYLDLNDEQHVFALVIFFALSYVLGVLLQEAARLILERASEWYIEEYRSIELTNEPLVVSVERLIRINCSERTLNGLERILFLKQIAATQFSVFGALLFLFFTRLSVRCFRIDISIVLFGGMGLCFWFYLEKARQQTEIIRDLLNLDSAG